MRIIFSILILATFALRPVIEMSNILYYQLNIDYIVEKYCVNKERPSLNCNGKCYLMSQMKAQTQSKDESTNTTISTETFIPLFFEDLSIQLAQNNPVIIKPTQNWSHDTIHLQSYHSTIDHPPEFYFS